jgi:UDP-N-acetylglucosamine:LPS N-acetylglucosamine transferase
MTEISERPEHALAESNLTDHVAPGLPGSVALLVGSSGGHLDHLVRLEPWWGSMERAWVTFDLPDARSRLAGETAYWAYYPTTRSAKNLVRNLGLANRVLREVQPDVVVSTGAGLAVPFFAIARTMGIPTVFLEVFDRVSSRTLTGRLCHPLSTRFLVQWPEQERMYPGSINVGSIYP